MEKVETSEELLNKITTRTSTIPRGFKPLGMVVLWKKKKIKFMDIGEAQPQKSKKPYSSSICIIFSSYR